MALLSGWENRVAITISNTNVDSNLTHFPVPLIINSSCGIGDDDIATMVFTELGAEDLKIAVTESDGTSELYVEVEQWDYDSGTVADSKAVLWVSKSDFVISSSSTTTVYLYFDSTHADNTAKVGIVASVPGQAVWDGDYELVYHLAEASGDIKDSTGSVDGTQSGGVTYGATGKVGDGISFDGSDDYIDTDSAVSQGTEYTVSVWAKWDTVGNMWIVTDKSDSETDPDWQLLRYQPAYNSVVFGAYDTSYNSYEVLLTPSTPPTGTWQMYAATVSDTDNEVVGYLNGSAGTPTAMTGTPNDTSDFVTLGAAGWNYSFPFDGTLDELRISSVVRTADWLKASYYAQDDNFLTWGIKQVAGIAGISADSSMSFSGLRLRPGAGSISSVPSLAIAGNRVASGLINVDSIPSLLIAGLRSRFALSAIQSIAALAIDGDKKADGISAINSVSSLISDGNRTASAVSAIESISSVIASGDRVASAIAAIVAVSSISSIAYRKQFAELDVNSSASLAIDADRIASAIVAINAISSLIADSQGKEFGVVAIQSIASLALDGNLIASGASEIASTTSIVADGDRIRYVIAALQSIASMSADPTRIQQAIAVINSVSSLDIEALRRRFGASSIESISSLSLNADVIASAIAAISSISSVSPDGDRIASAIAAIESISSVIPDGDRIASAIVAVAVVSSLIALGGKLVDGVVTISVSSELTAAAIAYITQSFGYTGTLTAGDVLVIDTDAMTVKLNGSSTRPLMTGRFPLLYVGTNELRYADGGETPDLTFETKHEPRYL